MYIIPLLYYNDGILNTFGQKTGVHQFVLYMQTFCIFVANILPNQDSIQCCMIINPLYLWGLKRSRYSDKTAWGDHGQTIPEHFLLKENKSSDHSMHNTRKSAFSPAYLLVLVEWVDDQLHHAVDFSLEGMFFGLFSELLNLRRIQSIQLDRLLLSTDSQMQHTDTGDTGARQITAIQQHSQFYWPGPVLQVKARHKIFQFHSGTWHKLFYWYDSGCAVSICVHKLGCVDRVQPTSSDRGRPRVHSGGIWLRQIFKVTPTAAPPHHLFWIRLCFCRGPPLRCHRRPPHPLL